MALGSSMNSTALENDPELEFTRLHITPLNPALLPSILPKAVLPLARNISFHSIQTFPEKDFGFVDLPDMEAQKVKKKLNGSILKGRKVRIEEARPRKQVAANQEDADAASKLNEEKVERPFKKRKTDTETIPAVELQGRKVKRGWTDPKAPKRSDKKDKISKGKKDTVKSKYTSNPECLFRTTLPANVAVSLKDGAETAETKNLRKKRKDKQIVVHEFSKTVKHATFLRSSGVSSAAKGVTEYVEYQGWVDGDGNVIEAVAAKPNSITNPRTTAMEDIQAAQSSTDSDESSVLESLSNSDDENAKPEVIEMLSRVSQRLAARKLSISNGETSSSETSSSGTSDSEDSEQESEANANKLTNLGLDGGGKTEMDKAITDSGSTTTPTTLKLDIPKTSSRSETAASVHPLEALYKRRRPDLQAPQLPDPVPSFAFFDEDADEDDDERTNNDITYTEPMTPYTRKDLDLRGHRSAAPTPDTAYPGKVYDSWPTSNPSNEAGEAGDASPTPKGKALKDASEVEGKEAPVSEFQKWFYGHRGEANRAWKRRRKLAAKEKRQRENRKRNERTV